MQKKSIQDLIAKNQELQTRLQEALETLDAIRRGEVDGVVVSTPKGEQVYTISGAEKPYRFLIEEMREGAAMLSDDNSILYCNRGFAKIVNFPLERIVGVNIERLISPTHKAAFRELLASGKDGSEKEAATKSITLLANDLSLVPTQMSVNSLRMDGTKTTFVVVTDLTEHMEEDVKRYTDGLEHEIQKRIAVEEALRKSQVNLLQSETKYRRLYETSQDGFMARDLKGRMIDCNPAYEMMLGYSKKELKNLSIKKLLPEKWQKPRVSLIKKVLETGESIIHEREYIRKDGTVFPASVRTWPLKNEKGETIGVWSIVRDITERKKAENQLWETRTYLENLLDHANAPIIVWDPKFEITMFNHAFEHLTGLGAKEVVGKGLDILFPKAKKEDAMAHIKDTLKGEYWKSVEIPISHKDGSTKIVLWNSANIMNPECTLVVATIAQGVDITERKKLEEELKHHTKNLESIVEERTKQLQDAERLAAIGATAGMVGHDIRNPLQAIFGDIYLAKAELTSISESEAKRNLQESLDAIYENSEYINKVVLDLQDFAKPIKPIIKETNLEILIQDLLAKNDIPKSVKASFSIDKDAQTIMVDPDLLTRILRNLTTNAVQAMPEGGELRVHAYRELNDYVLTVEDTGVGIPEGVRDKLFLPLFTTKAKGQGFGLAVVKKVTEALSGTVKFESQIGKGTKFIIRLPPTR